MSIVQFAGAETGDLAELTSAPSGWSASAAFANGSKGNYSYRNDATTASANTISGTLNLARVYFKCSILFTDVSTPASNTVYRCQTTDSAVTLSHIYAQVLQQTDGSWLLQVFDTTPSFITQTVIPSPSANTFYRFEFDLTIGAGTGALKVCWEGVEYINVTAQQFNSVNVGRVVFVEYQAGPSGRVFHIDDVAVSDSALPGDCYEVARSPTSGTPTYDSWAKSTGTDASALLNDTPFTATDFVNTWLSSVAQTALIGSFATTQSGHGSGVIQSFDAINAIKTALVGKTAATTATGITEVGTAQSGSSTAGANITLTFSVAPQAGDTVLVFGGFGTAGASNPGISTAGYSNQFADNATATRRFGVWSKVMGATPDTNVVCLGSGSAGDGVAYVAIVLRQIDNSVILDVAVASASGSSTNPNPPASGATVTANTWVLSSAASAVNDTSKGTQTSYTQEADASANATRPYSVALSHRLIAASGTNEDPAAWSSWSTGAWRAVTVTIRPALQSGSALSMRSRVGGGDTDTALTLTTSDAYYESAVLAAPSYANLNAMEFGALHGNNSLTQTVEDEWVLALFTPGVAPITYIPNVEAIPHLRQPPSIIGY